MPRHDRRTVLAAIGATGAALVAGCSGGGGGGDGDDGGGGDGDDGGGGGGGTTARSVLSRVDRTVSVAATEFERFGMNPNDSGTYQMEFTVTSGPAVDVYLMRVQQISYFENGVNFEYVTEGSVTDASEGSASTDLSSGQYFLVVDNSDRGEAAPGEDGGTAEVEVTATIEP